MSSRGRQPLISVVMPLYNAEQYVEQSIRSILTQTFVDFELLVVDDGSSDHSRDVVRGIADERVHLVQADHGGEGAARNVGLDHARGAYIAWQDADDVSLPQRLERMLRAMSDGISFSHHDMAFVDAQGTVTGYQRSSNFPEDLLDLFLLREGCPYSCATMLLRRSDVGDLRHSEEFRIGVDVDFVRRLVRGRRGVHVAEPLALYRQHGSSALSSLRKPEEYPQLQRLLDASPPGRLVPDAEQVDWPGQGSAVASAFIALCLARRGFEDAATTWFARAAGAAGTGSTAVAVVAAAAALAGGQPRRALDLLPPTVENSMTLVLRGGAEAMLGDLPAAASSYRQALELRPESFDALEGLRGVSEEMFLWELDSPAARLTGVRR